MRKLLSGTRIAIASSILLSGALCLAGGQEKGKTIKMVVGEQRVMAYEGLTSQTVAESSVAEAKTLPSRTTPADSFLLVARKAGETTLGVVRKGKPKLEIKIVVTGKGQASMPEVEGGDVLRLVVGGKKTMSFKGLQRLSVGNPKVADARPDGKNSIQLMAKGAGKTNMLVFLKGKPIKNYEIVVSEAAKSK